MLEAAASYLDGTVKGLAGGVSGGNTGGHHAPGTSTGEASTPAIPWALQQQLLQQYGHLMLEKMVARQSEPATSNNDPAGTGTH